MAKYNNQKVLAHLNSKWRGKACPMCGVGNWNVQDSIYQLIEFSEGGLVIGGPIIPVIPVVCTNCGNIQLVNAIVAGAVKPGEEADGAK